MNAFVASSDFPFCPSGFALALRVTDNMTEKFVFLGMTSKAPMWITPAAARLMPTLSCQYLNVKFFIMVSFANMSPLPILLLCQHGKVLWHGVGPWDICCPEKLRDEWGKTGF
jgi:hypothetical protein